MPQLKKKIEALPSITNWKIEEAVQNKIVIEGLEVSFCGIQAMNEAFGPVVGSATETHGDPWDRAWYELRERIAIVEAINARPQQFMLRDKNFKTIGMAPYQHVFPTPPAGKEKEWQPAKSNGVAIEQSWEKACSKAVWELAERHLILESWLGRRKPQRLPTKTLKDANKLDSIYDIWCVSFGAVSTSHFDESIHSCGVFLFPKNANAPMVFGFGGALNEQQALLKAESEAIQRLSFLWGEEIPTQSPDFAPNAMFHQEYFLQPAKILLLKKWLNGQFFDAKKKKTDTLTVQLADLSSYTSDNLFLARAVSSDALPLIFGHYKEKDFGELEDERVIHPIA